MTGITFSPGLVPPASEATMLVGLKALQRLYWDDLKDADTAMESVGQLDSLTELRITNSDLTTVGLNQIVRLRELEKRILGNCNRLDDRSLASLRDLPFLTWLSVDSCSISDASLADIGQIMSLRLLGIGRNRRSTSIERRPRHFSA